MQGLFPARHRHCNIGTQACKLAHCFLSVMQSGSLLDTDAAAVWRWLWRCITGTSLATSFVRIRLMHLATDLPCVSNTHLCCGV